MRVFYSDDTLITSSVFTLYKDSISDRTDLSYCDCLAVRAISLELSLYLRYSYSSKAPYFLAGIGLFAADNFC
jgi:hypothetical protein